MDLAGHGLKHVLQELQGPAPVWLFNELGYRELGCSVHAHEEIEPIVGKTVPGLFSDGTDIRAIGDTGPAALPR